MRILLSAHARMIHDPPGSNARGDRDSPRSSRQAPGGDRRPPRRFPQRDRRPVPGRMARGVRGQPGSHRGEPQPAQPRRALAHTVRGVGSAPGRVLPPDRGPRRGTLISANAQVMNGSGHYGLYQFSYSAWVAAGGNPADFGNASAAEQNQVFATAYAEDGTAPWAPYDGC